MLTNEELKEVDRLRRRRELASDILYDMEHDKVYDAFGLVSIIGSNGVPHKMSKRCADLRREFGSIVEGFDEALMSRLTYEISLIDRELSKYITD